MDLEGGSQLKIIENKKRVNGFSTPPNLHQISVFILLSSNIATYVFVEAREIDFLVENLEAFSILLGILLLGTIVSGYWTSSIDTEDPVVVE